VTVIDGTGAPPYGPATVVVEHDRIADIVVDTAAAAPRAGVATLDGRGLYLLPGFVDSHAHIDSTITANFGELYPPEYALKLWLAHGITSVREVGSFLGLEWTVEHARLSAAGTITAPRIFPYALFPQVAAVATPALARKWVRAVAAAGAAGIKLILDSQKREMWKLPLAGEVVDIAPEVHLAVIDEANRCGLRIAVHHGQTQSFTALDHARLGLASVEHFGGLPPALATKDGRAEPDDWTTCEPPGSRRWSEVIAELIDTDITLVPTFAILEARRDFMRASRAEWHRDYCMPLLARAFAPNPAVHGSNYLDATTSYEVGWRSQYRIWMQFVEAFKNAGGRVAAGSDAGFIYQLYGFGFIRELEMLQEAGLTPLEVVSAATRNGAQLLGMDDLGTVEVGKKADMILLRENPLNNFKVLYGTGHSRYDTSTASLERVGGVRYTIRDGIIWDAGELLSSIRSMVRQQHATELGLNG
jgi:imidazolonepropionase-like amidohydrolase